MLTIKKLSSTGFQTMNNTWYSVDVMKILKNKKFPYPFESLKVGDKVDNLKFQTGKNNKEYVIDFKVLPHVDIGVKEEQISPLVNNAQQVNSLKSSPSPIKSSSNTLNSQSNPSKSLNISNSDSKEGNDTFNVPIALGSDILERGKQVLNPQVNSTNSVQDSIRYAQCVNLAFQGTNFSQMNKCWYNDRIIDNFNLADEIFKEFNKRCSR